MGSCILFFASILAAAAAPEAPPATHVHWDAALEQLAGYRIGQTTNGLAAMTDCVLEADRDDEARLALEKRFLQFLQSDATLDAKHFVCRQLHLIGSAAAVPVLAGFLREADLADMARYALAAIPSPAVNAALLDVLPQARGRFQIGIINTLGDRRATTAVKPLLALVAQPDERVARATLGALRKIGGREVVDSLRALTSTVPTALRPLLTTTLLTCADDLWERGERAQAEAVYRAHFVPAESAPVRAAALRGLLRTDAVKYVSSALSVLASPDDSLKAVVAGLLRQSPHPAITQLLAEELPTLPPDAQVLGLRALAGRGDAAALPALRLRLPSRDANISVAAIQAVGALGGPKDLALLVEFLLDANPRKRVAAFDSLVRLRGAAVNGYLVALLKSPDTTLQSRLCDCLAARRAATAVPALLRLATNAPAAVHASAWRALGTLAQARDLPGMLTAIIGLNDPARLELAERALDEMLERVADPEQAVGAVLATYDKAPPAVRCAWLRVVGGTGNDAALARARAALTNGPPEVRDTAVRVLAAWPTAAPAADLLALVRATTNATHRVLAFQGLVRLAGLAARTAPPSAFEWVQQAMQLATSPAERKLVLSGLAGLALPGALTLAQASLDDAAVRAEAAAAVVKIATALAPRHADVVRPALQAALNSNPSPAVRQQAQTALQRLPAPSKPE